MSPKRLTIIILAFAVLVCLPRAVQPQSLTLRNAGTTVTGNLPLASTSINNFSDNFAALLDRDGNIVYFFNTDNWWGFCMGRYNVSLHRWELWTSSGWSAASDAIAQPIGESFFETSYTRYNEPNFSFGYLTPQSQDVFALVSGLPKIGKNDFDVHGSPYNFIFNGQKWQSYYANAYNDRLLATVIWNWGYSSRFSFGNNDTGQGLLITSGAAYGQSTRLYAARFDKQRGALNEAQLWTQWRNQSGSLSWHTSGTQTAVLTGQAGSMVYPIQIAYAGQEAPDADSYLMYDNGNSYKYRDSDQSWWIWFNGAWQPDTGQSQAGLVGTPLTYVSIPSLSGYKPADRLLRWNNEVLLVNQTEVGGSSPGANINYSKATGAQFDWIATAQPISGINTMLYPSSEHNTNFAATRTVSGDIALFYLSSPSSEVIELRKVIYNGSWQAPSAPLYSFNRQSGMKLRVLGALFTREQDGGSAVVFLKVNNNLLCLGDAGQAIWTEEQALSHTDAVPSRQLPDPARISKEVSFPNYNSVPPSAFYGSQSAWFLTQDSAGYLYAPQTGFCSIEVHAPNADNFTLSKHWGDFWEFTYFPGAISVDDLRGTVYFMDYLDGGGGGGNPGGRLRWLSRSYRDSFIDTYGGDNYPPPSSNDYLYTPAKLATGMVLDPANGWLFIASALTGKVLKYDIVNRDGAGSPTYLGEFISGLEGPVGMVQDENGFFYIIESLAQRVSVYSAEGSFVRAFGELGRLPGQFVYPTQIAYSSLYKLLFVADPMNERLQIFDLQGNYITSWGTWSSAEAGFDFQYLGGIFAKDGKLWASAGRTYYQGKIHRFALVDSTPTNVEISAPAPGSQLFGTAQVSYQADDDWGIVSADLLLDGRPVASQSFPPERSLRKTYNWDTSAAAECGEAILQVLVMDATAHPVLSSAVPVTIRNGNCSPQASSSSEAPLSGSSSDPTSSSQDGSGQQSSSSAASFSAASSRAESSSQSSAPRAPTPLSLVASYKRQTFQAVASLSQEQNKNCSLALWAAPSSRALSKNPVLLASSPWLKGQPSAGYTAHAVLPLGVTGPKKVVRAYFRAALKCAGGEQISTDAPGVKISSRRPKILDKEPLKEIARWLVQLRARMHLDAKDKKP
jgi:hypothetical protein